MTPDSLSAAATCIVDLPPPAVVGCFERLHEANTQHFGPRPYKTVMNSSKAASWNLWTDCLTCFGGSAAATGAVLLKVTVYESLVHYLEVLPYWSGIAHTNQECQELEKILLGLWTFVVNVPTWDSELRSLRYIKFVVYEFALRVLYAYNPDSNTRISTTALDHAFALLTNGPVMAGWVSALRGSVTTRYPSLSGRSQVLLALGIALSRAGTEWNRIEDCMYALTEMSVLVQELDDSGLIFDKWIPQEFFDGLKHAVPFFEKGIRERGEWTSYLVTLKGAWKRLEERCVAMKSNPVEGDSFGRNQLHATDASSTGLGTASSSKKGKEKQNEQRHDDPGNDKSTSLHPSLTPTTSTGALQSSAGADNSLPVSVLSQPTCINTEESALSASRATDSIRTADSKQDLSALATAHSAENSGIIAIPAVSSSTRPSPAPVLGTTSFITRDITGIAQALTTGRQAVGGRTDTEHPPGTTLVDNRYSELHAPAAHDSLHDSPRAISNDTRLGNSSYWKSSVMEVPEGETPPVAAGDDIGIPHASVRTDVGLASSSLSPPRSASSGGDTSLPHAKYTRQPSDDTDGHSARVHSETQGGGANSEPGLAPRGGATDPPHAAMDNIDRRAREIDPEQDASPIATIPTAETSSEPVIVRARSHGAASKISPSSSPSPRSAVPDSEQVKDAPHATYGDITENLNELALDSTTGGTHAQRLPLPAHPDSAADAATSPSVFTPANDVRPSSGVADGPVRHNADVMPNLVPNIPWSISLPHQSS
ncbi:hypothetical protein C8Q78DRAFT_1082477 [Trametes maxima]|nr:hypothetical protein C8Q78DRAFT_1082477 [Trametes maxima]